MYLLFILSDVNTVLFGYGEDEDDIDIESIRSERETSQEQAVDMTQQGYNRQYVNTTLKNKENIEDTDDIK